MATVPCHLRHRESNPGRTGEKRTRYQLRYPDKTESQGSRLFKCCKNVVYGETPDISKLVNLTPIPVTNAQCQYIKKFKSAGNELGTAFPGNLDGGSIVNEMTIICKHLSFLDECVLKCG